MEVVQSHIFHKMEIGCGTLVNSTTTSKILVNSSGHIYAGGYFTESTKFGNYEFENEGLYFGILSKDSDLDGAGDNSDAFPNNPNETTDTDGDGVGDNLILIPMTQMNH